MKKSKFEQYLIEKEEQEMIDEELHDIEEKVDIILEKFGSLDIVDAHEIGVPANTPIKFAHLIKAFEKSGLTPKAFMDKVKKLFLGITDEELAVLQSAVELKSFKGKGSGEDIFMKKSNRPSDFK